MIWPFTRRKSAVETQATPEPDGRVLLPTLPKRDKFRVVGVIDELRAEILFRTNGPDTHQWFDVSLLGISGEEDKGWVYIRGVGIRDRPGTKGGFVNFREILEIKDIETGVSYREWRDMAQFLRLAAGGVNDADAADLSAWKRQREIDKAVFVWKQAHGRRSTRKFDPSIEVVVEARTPNGQSAFYDVKLNSVVKFGRPFLIDGSGKARGSTGPIMPLTFTLGGYHTPGLEVIGIVEGDVVVTANPGAWLEERADRQRKTKPSTPKSPG